MDEEERKKKLEAGKAKLADYRKKKRSKKKKEETLLSTPREASHSEEVGAGDSIAVHTGDDNSLRALSSTDDTDNSTTTADDISTEEEGGFGLSLTPVERIQELEMTISDQQVALQKLTLENKELRDEKLQEKSIVGGDPVITELRDSVAQTMQHVRSMHQRLVEATNTVNDTDTGQHQIVAELIQTRQKLDHYEIAVVRQEEALTQMARKLEEKSLEAGEAQEKCRSLRVELEKSQVTSLDDITGAGRSIQEELDRERRLREEIEEKLEVLKQEHQQILERKNMDDPYGTYDPEDVRAYREQAALMKSQLETAYRDIDKLKREHDKEVIQLNQQLVSSVDEYETKLQEEKTLIEDLEQRLEMSDTVSSEIQSSFSKQLEQLEEERDKLRHQLRQAQTRAKENSTSKNRVQDMEDEVASYQTELAESNRRLEDAEKQWRQLRDELERNQEATEKLNNKKTQLQSDHQQLQAAVQQQTSHCEEMEAIIKEKQEEIERLEEKHSEEIKELERESNSSLDAAEEEKRKLEELMKMQNKEHSDELKGLHSQHHRQMDELKREMEKKLDSTKCSLEEDRKEQLETVKEVHEKNRDRELARLVEDHKEEIKKIKKEYKKELEGVKIEAEELKLLSEERIKIELQEEFDSKLEDELENLKRRLEQESDLAQAEQDARHQEEVMQIKEEHEKMMRNSVEEALADQTSAHEKELQAQKTELDTAVEAMKRQFEEANEEMAMEHKESLAKLESELEEIQTQEQERLSQSDHVTDQLRNQLGILNKQKEEAEERMTDLHQQLEKKMQDLEEDYKSQLQAKDTAFEEIKEKQENDQKQLEKELETVKEELLLVQNERDQIFFQAEESQKRLAALHHEETIRMQEEQARIEADYQEKTEHLLDEIESLRTSRNDLQDLRSQLLARNASVEEIEKLREEFTEEKDQLEKDKEEEMKRLRDELAQQHMEEISSLKSNHEEESRGLQEEINQLQSDLNENREKLEELMTSPVRSSPMLSLSQMSDYDSSNVAALNKDYRSAMTLTHLSDVSGLSDPLVQVTEQTDQEEVVKELKAKLAETESEMEKMKEDQSKILKDLQDCHDKALEELKHSKDAELRLKQDEISEAMKKMQLSHEEDVESLKEAHQSEMMKIRLQCASDTASQIEEETNSVRTKMAGHFEAEMDSFKHKMELESSEKLEALKQKHCEELEEQSEKLSSMMESRIAAVMSELHEQKQESLKKVSSDNEEKIKRMKEDFEMKVKEATDREEETRLVWEQKKEELEKKVAKFESDLAASQQDHKNLLEALDRGDDERIILLRDAHAQDVEMLRKKLEVEHEERQEEALKKQARIFEQAQSEFVKLHENQLEKFISAQKEDAESREEELSRRVKEMKSNLDEEYQAEKERITATHGDEMKVVATRLIEVEREKQELEKTKDQLLEKIDTLLAQKSSELAELKTTLVNQHMVKFQEVTANLDQLHKEEMEKMIEQHQQEDAQLQDDLKMMEEKLEVLEQTRKEELLAVESSDTRIREMAEEHKEFVHKMETEHNEQVMEIQSDHEVQLQQIEEEIQKQDAEHRESMKKILASQSEELAELQRKFDDVLSKTTEDSIKGAQIMSDRVRELESKLLLAANLKEEMEVVQGRKKDLESIVEEQTLKMQAWEEERREETKSYKAKIDELTESLDGAREEYKDLNARIEFERAEYESEIETIQEEVRNKEDAMKELEAEAEHKSAALDSLVKQHEMLEERREREAQEGANLLKMLRDDMERMDKERESVANANEQLLASLSDLVRANQRCEEVITRRLESLPLAGEHADDDQDRSIKDGTDTDSTVSPPNTSLSGSFVDEGLVLSQRFSDSMFAGPELDQASREVVANSGVRVGLAIGRVLDMLDSAVKKFNESQQAQTVLGDELQRVLETKQDDNNNERLLTDTDEIELQQRILELETKLSEQEELIRSAAARNEEVNAKELQVKEEAKKLEQEKDLLDKQKSALSEGREESELNLLRVNEELTNEKLLLIKCHQDERDRLEDAARLLETAMEQELKAKEEKESAFIAQIDDLNSQIEALRKQAESGNRFAAEMTTDREAEREQFEKELEAMRGDVEQARNSAKTESFLAQKVNHLEEELDENQQLQEESAAEMEKLKEKLNKREVSLEELRDRINQLEEEAVNLRSTNTTALEESQTQQEVLQKELYDNMLRISALEAQLDRYRHGVDEDALAALERAEAEERRKKEQGLQELEAKELEVEQLVEQQNLLRTQIIEKEEEVERLIESLENQKEIEAENAKLKEELVAAQNSAGGNSVSQTEQLQALSHHLLEDKNAEIDELRQQLALLQSGDEANDDNQQMLIAVHAQIEELTSHNHDLKNQLQVTEEQLQEALQKLKDLSESARHLEEEDAAKQDSKDEDTGIQDLSVGDLSHQEDPLRFLQEENTRLHRELVEARTHAENVIAQTPKDLLNLPPGTKEKIRDLEERLEKEDSSSDSSCSESSEENNNSLDSTHSSRMDVKPSSRDSIDIEEKLKEIEEELKSSPNNVFGRILRKKDEDAEEQDHVVEKLQTDLSEKEEKVEKLVKQVSQLEQELNQPDVRIRMRGEDDSIKMEQEEDAESRHKDDHSRDSNHEISYEHETSDESDACSQDSNDLHHVSEPCEKSDDSSSSSHDENAVTSDDHDVNEMKRRLDETEQEIRDRDDVIEEKNRLIYEKDEEVTRLLDEVQLKATKFDGMEALLHTKNDELLECKEIHASDVEKMKEEIEQLMSRASSLQEDRDKMSEQLNEVQRECSSLLEDNHLLDKEKKSLEEDLDGKVVRVDELERMMQKKDQDLVEARQQIASLIEQTQDVSKELQEMQIAADESAKSRQDLEDQLKKVAEERLELPQSAAYIGGGGDAMSDQIIETPPYSSQNKDTEATKRLLEENEALKVEITNLIGKTKRLEMELERTSESGEDLPDLQHRESSRIDSPGVEESYAGPLQLTRSSSSSSSSSHEIEEEKMEELKKEHQKKMEEMKINYAHELEEAVTLATKEQEERNNARLAELVEKHRQEINEILSESLQGDGELAQQLRNELDLADKLDNELINQLTAATQHSEQPIRGEEAPASPAQSEDIPSRLQHLLSRLHNEGVQVLSLSELQFLKQHRPDKNVSINTDAELTDAASHRDVDMEGLKMAWEGEKLALLDAIQALKELLTQTTIDAALATDDDQSLKWRGDLLRSVADLFEREKRALLAELRANVIEAHGEAELVDDVGAASRLESLERKIREQDAQHHNELERLLAADRDQLAEDLKQLKEERKEKLEQANNRVQQLQEQHKMAEETHKINNKHLSSQVECLKSKMQQEEALTSDLRTSLAAEKQRCSSLLPALQRERQRTLELSNEIASLSESSNKELSQAKQIIDSLRSNVDDLTKSLEEESEKLKELQENFEKAEAAKEKERVKQEEVQVQNQKTSEHLQAALENEERRRLEAIKAVEVERRCVAGLQQELTSERANHFQEMVQLRNRCDDLNSAVEAEKGRCQELQNALEQEATLTHHARLELENERKMTSEAREHDRATVADLQSILEEAKKETERVQKRVEIAEQEREEAIQKAEEEHLLTNQKLMEEREQREEVIMRERQARSELQTALEAEKLRKQDAQKRIRDLEERSNNLLAHQDRIGFSSESQNSLLADRRHLESLRQRLQLEASKLQNMLGKVPMNRHQASPVDFLLSSDEERVESISRSLQDMQDELKQLYSSLSLPGRVDQQSDVRSADFNNRLLQRNAELSQFAADAAKETKELKEEIAALKDEPRIGGGLGGKEEQISSSSISNPLEHNQQKMASRIHRLYTRLLRAESFKKSLVYQKKYLLLLLGGFQDCEEATLALIARMGAYPSNDALRRTVTHRSPAFTRFRSAVRVVMAVSRLKFLVRKWKKASNSVTSAIQNKHGIALASLHNGSIHSKADSLHPFSRTPSPQLGSLIYTRPNESMTSQPSGMRYPNDSPSRESSPYAGNRTRSSTRNNTPKSQGASRLRDDSFGLNKGDYRRYSPASVPSFSAVDQSQPGSDPSLNEYIKKLENIQHKLRYPR